MTGARATNNGSTEPVPVHAARSPMVGVVAFFLLTFVLTWAIWFGTAALAGPANAGFFGVGGPVFLFGVFAPAIVALALTAREEGRDGVARLLSRIGRWRVGARWYVFAVVYFPATQLAAAAIYRRITGRWPRFDEFRWPLVLGALFVSTWTQAGEELGWRGFALPRLAERFGLGTASVVVGVVWALWHLPLFYIPGSGSEGQSFLMYLLHVTALSVAMAWLYWETDGSLLLVMLMHAAVNNVRLVPAVVNEATPAFAFGGSLIGWLIVGVSWAVAAPMLIRMRGRASALESRPATATKQSC